MKKGSRGEGLFDFYRVATEETFRSAPRLFHFFSILQLCVYNRGSVPIIEDDGGVGEWRYAYCSTLWR